MNAKSRLCRDALVSLEESQVLGSGWREPSIGIVHLGIGNFHRAHEAVYTEEAMLAAGGDWAICGVTLQGDITKRDALMAQDGLYGVVERGPEGVKTTVVRALREVLAMPHDRIRLFELLADANVRIVSLTVTEKGYCRDPKSGDIALEHAGVAHDLHNAHEPGTVPGILVAALRARRDAGVAPFTVLSCDNLSHNGAALRQVVCSYARALDTELAAWIEREVAFPSTMVDRIVPSTTDVDRDAASSALGLRDEVPVPCEPFRQWVIEDRFTSGRPAWDRVGAQLVDDVMPFELAKLRMLNATHSTLAYLSMLGGFATIDDAISFAPMRTLILSMMTYEIAPTLSVPPTFDLMAYRDALLERYANPALKHRCAQIAMDGSQKIPPRLLGTIATRLARGESIPRLALGVGAWLVFLRGRADDGSQFAINDPMAARLKSLVEGAGETPEGLVDAVLGCREVFNAGLAANQAFRHALIEAVAQLNKGARAAIEHAQGWR
jgi:fructuronate reductase